MLIALTHPGSVSSTFLVALIKLTHRLKNPAGVDFSLEIFFLGFFLVPKAPQRPIPQRLQLDNTFSIRRREMTRLALLTPEPS